MSAATVGGFLAIAAATVTAVLTAYLARRKDEASTAEILVRTSRELLDPLRAEIRLLRSEVLGLRGEVSAAQAETARCHEERDADRRRLHVVELELARYKAGPSAGYNKEQSP